MTFWEKPLPGYLTEKGNMFKHVIFTAIFALVFINMYAPFGVETWYNVTKTQLLIYSSLVILSGVLFIAISRAIMFFVSRLKALTNGQYASWIAIEITSMALVYAILMKLVLNDPRDFLTVFRISLSTTLLVLLIPYTLAWLYFSWRDKNKKLEELAGAANPRDAGPALIPFHDEKGDLRFSVKSPDLLYIESADNYIIIHYLDHGRRQKYVVRNTIKNIETVLRNKGIIRCHRSYMVNFERVKIMRKERDGLVLDLDVPEKLTLPVSKTYVDQIIKTFSGLPSE
ncbi:MAG: LytR/AlgR family response regulator transcription factor [Bacteroidales bacterium]|nr:LytTR family transcriptional regulator [Bacteroidales bacterium]HQK36732.1 LytTR family DNA-binding domain-containing protein [Bacteroidales bacterium]